MRPLRLRYGRRSGRVIHLLWPGTEPILFGRVPLRMVIETADGGILIVFLGFGLYKSHEL